MRIALVALALCRHLSAQIPAPPGKRIDIGGRSLHINCTGQGSPAVILEAGFPGSSLDWLLVQPAVARTTTVCSYDRAGFGWSELGNLPPSGEQIVADLHKLLPAAGVQPPYVLVGHSLGGIYVRMFTTRHPNEVVGLVLVDATHEDQWDYELMQRWIPGEPDVSKRPSQPPVVRPPEADAILRQMWQTENWKTGERRERDAIKLTMAEIQKQPRRLPLVPLIVLSAGERLDWLAHAGARAWQGQQLQRELAALSGMGEWAPVSGANHYIHLSKPEAVVNAIERIVQASRKLKPVTASP